MIAVCRLRDDDAGNMSEYNMDFIDRTHIVSLTNSETLSVIHLHQKKDLLCVGTAHSGLYLTSASNPIFSNSNSKNNNIDRNDNGSAYITTNTTVTKLPLRLTGENIFAVCFIDAFDRESDVLVISCGLESVMRDRFRVCLWDVQSKSLLWRGCADALDVIVPLPGVFGFATCSSKEVALWTVQCSAPTNNDTHRLSSSNGSSSNNTTIMSINTRNKSDGIGNTARSEETGNGTLTVLSKPCSSVNELRDAEFVSILPPATAADTTLTALTTVGFLVSFDRCSGAPVKWMDSKVCPATAVYRSTTDIIVCGALIRFFSTEKWEFRGKIKHNNSPAVVSSSFLNRLMDSLCTGAAVSITEKTCNDNKNNHNVSNDSNNNSGSERIMLFFSGGDMSRYNIFRPGNGTGKLSFHCVYQQTPVLPDEVPLRWIPIATDAFCLWSPRCLRFYDSTLRFQRSLTLESTCVAHHRDLGVLLLYESSTYEVVAVTPNVESVLSRLGVAEPLISLVVHEGGQFVGLSPDNSLFYFDGEWKEEGKELVLRVLRTTRLTNFDVPLTQLVSVEGALFVASSHIVSNLLTGAHVRFSTDITSFTSVGSNLLVTQSDSCVVVDATTLKVMGDPLEVTTNPKVESDVMTTRLKEVVPTLSGDVVALRSDGEISILRLADRYHMAQISTSSSIRGNQASVFLSVGFTTNGDSLVLSDSKGLLSLYKLGSTGRSSSASTRTSRHGREHGGSRRSSSCGGPSSVELQYRFKDLHGFYETTKQSHSERPSSRKRASSATNIRREAISSTGNNGNTMFALEKKDNTYSIQSGQEYHSLPPMRKWENDRAPAKLPRVFAATEGEDVRVSASMVDVSALTSIDSRAAFNLHTVTKSEADLTPSLEAEITAQERAKVRFAGDVPTYGVRSPARKGQPSLSPVKTTEDDVVNIESMEREEMPQRGLHTGGEAVCGFTPPRSHSVASVGSSSVRALSLEVRDRLRELADAYEQQLLQQPQDDMGGSNADSIDDETVEELFTTASRLFARLQSRQQSRPGSVGSAASDMSSVSVNIMMADLQRLQRQNSRIEAQNEEILARLRAK
ncbi:uncharacterized protein TM35_000401700 [Trypanosoma theileri]|uniref:Uncharacterized protein n=1 Tax=Trypanosoma theileri TaxID=67003 RepID=A0A1X0NKC0_9TRYP|nr:uncharacterized protein TM35_000401700 [Trypanosoma theileri]ORC84903.1 hypothetical protein TM35_000401700 [Trypanosoma theileri]